MPRGNEETVPYVFAGTPSDFFRYAVESGADASKLCEAAVIMGKVSNDKARDAFTEALAKFHASHPTIRKNKEVSHETKGGGSKRYHHADLANVTQTLAPALAAQGLTYWWETESFQTSCKTTTPDGEITGTTNNIRVTCHLQHVCGHSISASLSGVPDASGGKNAIQATQSTSTYLQRYTLLSVTGMATEDQDDDGDGGGAKGAFDACTTNEELKNEFELAYYKARAAKDTNMMAKLVKDKDVAKERLAQNASS